MRLTIKNYKLPQSINNVKYFIESQQKRDIQFIVLHHTQANNIDQAIKLYIDHGVSPHYVINDIGDIYNLVEPNNIAFHAGCSYWQNIDQLNNSSIGIELLSKDPFKIGFNDKQMDSLVKLCQEIIKKYKIEPSRIVAHSDIAYDKETLLLNRKQDPSHLFDWSFLAKNNIAKFPELSIKNDHILYKLHQKDDKITKIKEKLNKFGYKVTNFSNNFDQEMKFLCRNFNQRFNPSKFDQGLDIWYLSSDLKLDILGSDPIIPKNSYY